MVHVPFFPSLLATMLATVTKLAEGSTNNYRLMPRWPPPF